MGWDLKKRKHFAWRAVIYAAGLILLTVLIIHGVRQKRAGAKAVTAGSQDGDLLGSTPLFISSVIFSFTALTLLLGLFLFLFEVSWQEALFCATCAYMLQHIGYCLNRLIFPFSVETVTQSPAEYIVFVLVAVAAYFWFSRKIIQDGHYPTTAQQSLKLVIIVALFMIVLSSMATARDMTTVHGIYGAACCIFVLSGIVRQEKNLAYERELNLQKSLWERNRAQYEAAKEAVDLINAKSHDLKHQARALQAMADSARQEEVARDIENSVAMYDVIYHTGNSILDTILTEKAMIAKNNGIAFTCIADGEKLAFMDAVDMYTMLGNALDNATEAVLKMPPERRMIDFKLYEKGGLILLQVENPFDGTLLTENGDLLTSKDNKTEHGFGVKSIRNVAEKYDGLVKVQAEEGLFTLRISFLS